LRKMQSKPCDLAIQLWIPVLWRGCGTSDVRARETSMRLDSKSNEVRPETQW
jgi:hypothetical protein